MPHQFVAKLHKGREKRIRSGHLWVYAGEIAQIHGEPELGSTINVISHNGRFLGRGYYNPNSQITIRLLTTNDESIDQAFFANRIREALAYRERVMPGVEGIRVLHGEGDLLPGLVVDRFKDVLVVQILTLGIEVRKDIVFAALGEVLAPKGIFERSDVSVRRLEGLEERKGLVKGTFDPGFTLVENGCTLSVDVAEGQKTGYFLDQKENRLAVQRLVKPGDEVLDAFCHTGTFGINAGISGAGSITFLDISEHALETARTNTRLNGLEDRSNFVLGNAFDELRKMERNKQQFDVVVLDPPAFTKNRDSIQAAARGYKEVNLRGFKLARKGGFVVTCSCSHHMSRDHFYQVATEAALDAGVRLRLIEYRSQSKDHPILTGMPETEYLKCAIFQVL